MTNTDGTGGAGAKTGTESAKPAAPAKGEVKRVPTIRRMVLYRPTRTDLGAYPGDEPLLAAVVTKVWNETTVELTVLPPGGKPFFRNSVSEGTTPGTWCWDEPTH